MVYKTYIDKFNTIVSGSKINTGLNPISELVWGKDTIVSRALIHFDHSRVKELMDNGTMPNISKMRHILKITNAGSLDFTQLHKCETSSINDNKKVRAVSFDLIFFLIPKDWDAGKGFDFSKNYFNVGFYSRNQKDPERLVSEDASNWFQRMNGLAWDEPGVYSNDTLALEYDKWAAGEESIVIGRQHFDLGNESIEFDITDTFNKFLYGDIENHGIGIAFSPLLEATDDEYENYVGFLTNRTNTFFEPHIDTIYSDVVMDDRANFVLGKKNRLYLYCTIGDQLENLDINPTVTIRDGNGEIIRDSVNREMTLIMSKKQSKGVYYIEFKLPRDIEPDTMFYDTWTNIQYQGGVLDDVELDFTVKQSSNYFNIGNSTSVTNVTFSPSVSGIQEKEQILRGNVRKLVIKAKPSYSTNTVQLVDDMSLRMYVMDGEREIDVIEWDAINRGFSENYYLVDTGMLIPQTYHIDIRIKYGMNSIIHHDVLKFDIVSSLNNKYW